MKRKRTHLLRLAPFFLVLLAAMVAAPPVQAQGGAPVYVLTMDGIISPVSARYIEWGIRIAEAEGANCLVIILDTPGGLATSTGEIARAILNAKIPVIVYVSPLGARAASAGVYIIYAAHVAAMAPNTHLGAATPVAIGGGGAVEIPDEMQRKIEEDALASLRASAQERGRNAEWGERAVREGVSATAGEALQLNVVDLLASDLDDLLRQIDGRTIRLASGHLATLQTAGAPVQHRPMSVLSQFLMIITEPTVAYILLAAGLLGLWFEITNPGISLPGVLGGVCIILGLYALGTLAVNWAGVLLIVFAFILFAVDLFTPTNFVLTIGGIVAFVMGSLLLFNFSTQDLRIELWSIVLLTGVIVLLIVLCFILAILRKQRGAFSGQESLVGMPGVVRKRIDPAGQVFVDGALWQAHSEEGPLESGTPVEIVAADGMLLRVRRSSK